MADSRTNEETTEKQIDSEEKWRLQSNVMSVLKRHREADKQQREAETPRNFVLG